MPFSQVCNDPRSGAIRTCAIFIRREAGRHVSCTVTPDGSLGIKAANQGPQIEMSNAFLTIIRWTVDNPGGSPEHFGIVHYGTDPKNLDETAKSPIRLNPGHASTVFRVRVEDLQPITTYYYKVGSIEANGANDGMTGRQAL
jgi:purple acid phosphatase-like protein